LIFLIEQQELSDDRILSRIYFDIPQHKKNKRSYAAKTCTYTKPQNNKVGAGLAAKFTRRSVLHEAGRLPSAARA